MMIELLYYGQKIQVEADIVLQSIKIESDQLAKMDFLIVIAQWKFQNGFTSFAGQALQYREPDWHTIQGKEYDFNLLADLFGRPAMIGCIVPTIEESVTQGSKNFLGNVLHGFEFHESLKGDSPITVDEKKYVLINKEVTIEVGNRLHAAKIANISFVNFIHFALREYLGDTNYQLTTLPNQFTSKYSNPNSMMFQTAFLDSLRNQCEREHSKITFTLSNFYKYELQNALEGMAKSFSNLLDKKVIVATKEEKAPEEKVQQETTGQVTISFEALRHPEVRKAIDKVMDALGSVSLDSQARRSLIGSVASSGIAGARQTAASAVEMPPSESIRNSK